MKYIFVLILPLLNMICYKSEQKTRNTNTQVQCKFLDYKSNDDIQNLGYKFSSYNQNNRIGYSSLTILKEIESTNSMEFSSKMVIEKFIEIARIEDENYKSFLIHQWCFNNTSTPKKFLSVVKKLKKGVINRKFKLNWKFISCNGLVIHISSEEFNVESQRFQTIVKDITGLLDCENPEILSYEN